MSEELTVQDGQVVSMSYVLHVEGQIYDMSDDRQPFRFIQGAGQIIPGLESALYGLSVGERKVVTVAPADGYGEIDPDAFVDLPKRQFPATITLEPGVEVSLTDEHGHSVRARIDHINENSVTLDVNHPLAGKELQFDVQILAIRPATSEELEHGHVHD